MGDDVCRPEPAKMTPDERRWWKRLCRILDDKPESIRLLAAYDSLSAWRITGDGRDEERLDSTLAGHVGQLADVWQGSKSRPFEELFPASRKKAY